MFFNMNIKLVDGSSKIKPTQHHVHFIIDSKKITVDAVNLPSVVDKDFVVKKLKDESKVLLSNTSKDYSTIQFIKIKKEEVTADTFRDKASEVIQQFSNDIKNTSEIYFNFPKYSEVKENYDSADYYYQSIIEGIHLGNYNFDKFKMDKKKPVKLNVTICDKDKINKTEVKRSAENIIDSVYFTRDLVNEPANVLTPNELLVRTKKTLSKEKVKVTSLNYAELKKKNYNSIISVGKGSENKPLMMTLHYKPSKKSSKKICLVGKGVTYDSGGLSLKPTEGMLDMKADMAGAALVIGTVLAVAKNKLPVEVIGIVPAVENMVSSNCYKPGDVISTSSGKTIEVKNTDAEGRLILADALEYASKLKPDTIIDFATLTGACVVALGELSAGLFTKSKALIEKLMASSETTFEKLWPMPFGDEYKQFLKSDIADISNLGPRWGGAITAGKFLEFFVDKDIEWAHVDVAGPATKNDLNSYTKKYCTGYGVRLIHDYIKNI